VSTRNRETTGLLLVLTVHLPLRDMRVDVCYVVILEGGAKLAIQVVILKFGGFTLYNKIDKRLQSREDNNKAFLLFLMLNPPMHVKLNNDFLYQLCCFPLNSVSEANKSLRCSRLLNQCVCHLSLVSKQTEKQCYYS
jgi:hypothetical protein